MGLTISRSIIEDPRRAALGDPEQAPRGHFSIHAADGSGRRALTEAGAATTTERPIVFLVDDDASVREAVADLLTSVGLDVQAFGSIQEFLQSPRPDLPGCIVLDVRLPGTSGLEFQRGLAESGKRLPIIIISGHGDIGMSVRAMKLGAVEVLDHSRCASRNCSTRSRSRSSATAFGGGRTAPSPN